ncbi:MAG: hypothetical protein V7L22_32770 [Nostoc sp.]|uniref:hypothetical protein n=1 Tax=Nostoc sp. TaxID=1180 RepID=UPI002FFA6448
MSIPISTTTEIANAIAPQIKALTQSRDRNLRWQEAESSFPLASIHRKLPNYLP